jgi:uncharacterized membrane protein
MFHFLIVILHLLIYYILFSNIFRKSAFDDLSSDSDSDYESPKVCKKIITIFIY